MPLKRQWTDEENTLLGDLWSQKDLSLQEISRQLGGIYPETIKVQAKHLGLESRVFQKWSERDRIKLVRLWGSGSNTAEICKRMPRHTRAAIISKLDRLGLLNGASRGSGLASPHGGPITLVRSCASGETYTWKPTDSEARL